MWSTEPMPGNPWPHDMAITIDEPNSLIDLLWIRAAWDLHPVGDDLPPSLSERIDPPSVAAPPDRIGAWERGWGSIWTSCVRHAGDMPDGSEIMSRLQETADGSAERAQWLDAIFGPTWRDEFGDDAFDYRYQRWVEARFDAQSLHVPVPLEKEPERMSLTALISAWKLGLTRIITVPCEGSFTRAIGPNTLLVTGSTREDAKRYSEALGAFRPVER